MNEASLGVAIGHSPASDRAVAVAIAILHPPIPAPKRGKPIPWQVLLSRKPGEITWHFPWGVVEPTDRSLEAAASRKAQEELDIPATVFDYIGSYRVNDWRYSGGVDPIITAFFRTEVSKGQEKAGDDFRETKLFEIGYILPVLDPAHLKLAWRLIASLSPFDYKHFDKG